MGFQILILKRQGSSFALQGSLCRGKIVPCDKGTYYFYLASASKATEGWRKRFRALGTWRIEIRRWSNGACGALEEVTEFTLAGETT